MKTENNSRRFEVIDKCDIICATADLKADALFAASQNPGSYVFDTLLRKVVK